MGFKCIYILVGFVAMCNCAALSSQKLEEQEQKDAKDDLKPAASNAYMENYNTVSRPSNVIVVHVTSSNRQRRNISQELRRRKIRQKIHRLQAQLQHANFRENRGDGRERNRRSRKQGMRQRIGKPRRQNYAKEKSTSTSQPPQPHPPPQPMLPSQSNIMVPMPQKDWGSNGYGYNGAPGYQADARYNGYGYDNSMSQGFNGYNGYYNNAGYNGYNRGYSYGVSPGYGGYGGHGGNGGLNSYYGYNNPYYQGANNHLGYGYYSKPGFGNIYNNGITPNLVTGYRGYSK